MNHSLYLKIFKNKFKFLDPRNIDNSLSESKKYAWYRDQYQNPKEFSYRFGEILEWFGFAISTQNIAAVLFAVNTLLIIGSRGIESHKWYKKKFKIKVKEKNN